MKKRPSNLRQEIKSLYFRALLSLIALTLLSVLILLVQVNVSKANRVLSDLQFSLAREARLINATMEKFRFVVKYQDQSKPIDSFFENAVVELAEDFGALQKNAEHRTQLLETANSNWIIKRYLKVDTSSIEVPQSEIELYSWAKDTFSSQQTRDDLRFTIFVGPLEIGLLNRESSLERNNLGFTHLQAARERLETLQQWIYFVTIFGIITVLLVMVLVALLPAIRQVLRAEKETNVKNRIRESLSQFTSLFQSNDEITALSWSDFVERLVDAMKAELPEINLDIYQDENPNFSKYEQYPNVASSSGIPDGDTKLTAAIYYSDDWSFAEGELTALAEKIMAFALLVRNITLRFEVEADRDVYFSYLDEIVHNSPIGLGLFDLNGSLVLANGLFQTELDDIIGPRVENDDLKGIVQHAKDKQHFELSAFFDNEYVDNLEQRNHGKTIRWQRVSLNEGGTLVAVQDITDERKQLVTAEHKRRLEALGKISSGISHDINNFLAIILNNIELAQTAIREQTQKDYLESAEKACLAASKVNEQLLSYSRRQPLMPSAVDTDDILESVKAYVKQVGREDDLKLSVTNARAIWADMSSLTSAILNLTINALDATKKGESIQLDIRDTKNASNQLAIEITVTDKGTGFVREPLECLEPFFTTKDGGSGLGLAAVEGFVAQSKGQLELGNNADGIGAFVRMTLPASDRKPVKKEPLLPAKEQPFTDEEILIVDDNRQILRTIDILLKKKGYRTKAVESLEDALDVLNDNASPYSLLISDIVLNDGTGFDVAKAYLNVNPNGRIIYISGHPCAEFERELSITPGAFLAKPFHLASLSAKVEEELAIKISA